MNKHSFVPLKICLKAYFLTLSFYIFLKYISKFPDKFRNFGETSYAKNFRDHDKGCRHYMRYKYYTLMYGYSLKCASKNIHTSMFM